MGSYWDGYSYPNVWCEDETIEVVLNLEEYKVEYYRIQDDNETTKIKEDNLSPDKMYYFALCMDCDEMCCVFESVLPTLNIHLH